MSQFINFKNLKLRKTNNQHLVLPKEFVSLSLPNALSPKFSCDLEKLKIAFVEMIDKQPRISKKVFDNKKNKFSCIQKTKFFKFPDMIDIEFIKIDNNFSSIAIFSRSVYGYYDFNVNKNRVNLWLNILVKSLTKDE